MNQEIIILITTAVSLGFMHTLFGPDHYIPFIVMSKSKKWSMAKTAWVTTLCGLGHVLSSVVIGIIGIALGLGLSKIEFFESQRGSLAGWLFIAFGLGYMIWGIRQAVKNKPHTHPHIHSDGSIHKHEHTHHKEHSHVHESKEKKFITPWMLFIIFVFGPCEVLIPMLMYPAAQHNTMGTILVTLAFGLTTLLTMLTMVLVLSFGIHKIPFGKVERYSTAIAGATLLLCGISINFLGF